MSLHVKTRTLKELRTELAIRLGFVSVGQAAVTHDLLLTSFLQEASEQIYAQYGDDLLYKVNEQMEVHEGQRFYEFPVNADPFSITDVLIEVSDGAFRPVKRGIPLQFRTAGNDDPGKRGIPSLWDIGAGEDEFDPGRIELWKVPDSDNYRLHFSFYPFYAESGWNRDDMPCPIYPSRLCLLMAIANAKSHYGMGDASNYYSQFDQLLQKHKASLLSGQRFGRQFQYGTYRDEGIGSRKRINDDIVVDLTPSESIISEAEDTILPESSA
jgi:hypothetical protein